MSAKATSTSLGVFTVSMALACTAGGIIYDAYRWQGLSIFHCSCQGSPGVDWTTSEKDEMELRNGTFGKQLLMSFCWDHINYMCRNIISFLWIPKVWSLGQLFQIRWADGLIYGHTGSHGVKQPWFPKKPWGFGLKWLVYDGQSKKQVE